ncbi:MAG TPA: hypothetical protein VJT75_10055, partial [Thermoleophilaceae bacterium]|nr:hypothetical protein [Thermoleophilaceae bacterium]
DGMYTLLHHPFCPQSRFIRLALGEVGRDVRLVEEPLERGYALALDASGEPLTGPAAVRAADGFDLRMHGGTVPARVRNEEDE